MIGADESYSLFHWPRKSLGSSIIKGQTDIPNKAFLFSS